MTYNSQIKGRKKMGFVYKLFSSQITGEVKRNHLLPDLKPNFHNK